MADCCSAKTDTGPIEKRLAQKPPGFTGEDRIYRLRCGDLKIAAREGEKQKACDDHALSCAKSPQCRGLQVNAGQHKECKHCGEHE